MSMQVNRILGEMCLSDWKVWDKTPRLMAKVGRLSVLAAIFMCYVGPRFKYAIAPVKVGRHL